VDSNFRPVEVAHALDQLLRNLGIIILKKKTNRLLKISNLLDI